MPMHLQYVFQTGTKAVHIFITACNERWPCQHDKVVKNTVELQWLEHLWDYENLFETGVVQPIEG